MNQSNGKGKSDNDGQGDGNRNPLLGKHPRKSATNEANHRSDGKIDSAGYDDQSNANAYDPKKGRSSKQVLQVVGIQKHVTENGRGYKDEDEEGQDTEYFFHMIKEFKRLGRLRVLRLPSA